MRSMTATRRLLMVATLAATACGCALTEPLSPEQAVAERAAIHHDLRHDSGTLYKIAANKARSSRPELRDRSVVCAISNIDIRFVHETKAIYTVAYACGVEPWKLGHAPPMATPTIALDVWKEGGTWQINGPH
jgi:hypothetical protein